MATIGERLKRERLRLGYTQQTLAGFGGVQVNAQRRYESGQRMPRADYLASVGAVGVDVQYVLLGPLTPKALDMLKRSNSEFSHPYARADD